MSESRRSNLDTNIAYIYMRLGKYEAAEECFKKLLEEGEPNYNKGVTLLNYTHMLNLQGRYKETLELLTKYEAIGKRLDKDLYGSYLLGNRAIAESNMIGYDQAFHTLLRSKELGDSISYNSGIQDGLLMLDYSEQSLSLKQLENKLKDRNVWLWTSIGLIGLLTASTLWLIYILYIRDKERHNMESLLAECNEKSR